MVKESVDERAGPVPAGGVHDEPGLFVDGDEVLIFKDDVQRDIFGERLRGGKLGERDADTVAGAEDGGGFGGAIVDHDDSGFDELLKHGAGIIGEAVAKVQIDALLQIVLDVEGDFLERGLGGKRRFGRGSLGEFFAFFVSDGRRSFGRCGFGFRFCHQCIVASLERGREPQRHRDAENEDANGHGHTRMDTDVLSSWSLVTLGGLRVSKLFELVSMWVAFKHKEHKASRRTTKGCKKMIGVKQGPVVGQ